MKLDNAHLTPDIRIRDWRIQLDLFGYLAVTAFVASTISTLNQLKTPRGFIFHILINVVAFASLYYFWRLMAHLIRRLGNSALNIWQIMSIGFMGGVLFTVAQFCSAWLFQVSLPKNFQIELISFALPAAFWLPACSVISSNYRKYLRLKREVREEFLQQDSIKLARTRALEEYRARLEEQIQKSLRVTTQEAASLFFSLKNREIKNLPYYLRVISSEYFRLTAHQMVKEAVAKDSIVTKSRKIINGLMETVFESVEARPLNPTWYATIISVTTIPPILAKDSFGLALEIIAVIGIFSYLIQSTQLQIAQYYKVNLRILASISISLNIIIPLTVVRSLPSQTPPGLYPLGFALLVFAINFLGHLAQVGLLKSEDFRSRALESVEQVRRDESESSLIFAGITRSWAQHIHGTFTSKLESSALALEAALRDADFVEVENLIDQVGKFLKEERIPHSIPQKILLDEIEQRCSNWNGLIEFEITANIDRESIIGVSIAKIGTCIEEAILNASRHGNCSWIGIELVNTEMLFQIIIRDNGSGFTKHQHGFGSSIFTEATDGQWDIWRDEGQSLTVVQLNFRKIA